jgi:hypothetical protein
VLWNAQHDWVGFLRQGGRVADWRPERAAQFLSELVGGQIGLATPGIFVLVTAGIVVAIRMSARLRDPASTLLAALTLPPVLVFVQHAVGDRVEGNWPAIIYPAAAVAAAGILGPTWRPWIRPSCGLGFLIAAGLYVYVMTGWPALPGARDPVARQLFGWDDLAAQVETVRQTAHGDFIVAEPYGVAAELAWSMATKLHILATGPHWASTALPQAEILGRRGLLVRPDRYGNELNPAVWRDVIRLPNIVRSGANGEIERYAVFLVSIADEMSPVERLPAR